MAKARKAELGPHLNQSAWRISVVALMGFALALRAGDASACGSTPLEVYPLLPMAGQTEVPLNAVLTLGLSVPGAAAVELVRAESEEAVPLSGPHCEDTLCTAVPVSALEPKTSYRYRAGVDGYPMIDWIEFTTGDRTDDAAPGPDEVVVDLKSSKTVDEANCGKAVSATIMLDATRLEAGPVAVIAPGAMPSFLNPGVIMQVPGQTTVELRRVSECFTPAVIDSAGHQTELSPICAMSGLGCSLARRGPADAGASFFAFALLALFGLGRRWRRSPARPSPS